MQTGFKDNNNVSELGDPPIPPEPHFDENEIADARRVQPLNSIRFRRTRDGLRRFAGGRAALIALIIVGLTTSIALGAAFLNWQGALPPAQAETADSIAQPIDEPASSRAAAQDGNEPAALIDRHPSHPKRSLRKVRPPLIQMEVVDGNPKARLVGIIH